MGLFSRRSNRTPDIPTLLEAEVRDEIRFYLEMRAKELEGQGLSREEALSRAIEAFGNPDEMAVAAVQENGGDDHVTGGWVEMMHNTLQDVRYALRNLRKAPGFTAAAVLTLALGLGGATAIFSVVSGVLMRPLPFPESDRLVAIHTRWTAEAGYEWDRYPLGSPEYFDYIDQSSSMEVVGAETLERVTYRPEGGDPRMLTAGGVSPNLFTTLRVPPLLGRTLLEEDGGATPAAVVVLSYDFWQRELGGDSTVVGRRLELAWERGATGVGSVVVGVMPEGFVFPDPQVELWAPLLLDRARVWRGGHWFRGVARLADGVSLEEAQTEMAGIMTRWRDDYPDHHRGHFLYLTPLLDDIVAEARPTLALLLGAVGFVLLIACANVASLLLARGSYRGREMAIRRALGAERGRLLRQLLTEALILAAMGGGAGLAVSVVGVDLLLALEGGGIPRGEVIGLDGRVLAFAGVLVLFTTLIFGLLPALQSASADLANAFSEGGRSMSSGRDRLHLRKTLVVAEVSFALLLVVGAGLMTKSVWTTLNQDPGFSTQNLLTVRLTLPQAEYTPEEQVGFMNRLSEQVASMPGVEEVGTISRPPLLMNRSETRFVIDGNPELESGDEGPTGSTIMADRGLLDVLGIRAVRGRLFDSRDVTGGPPVALIDEEMARTYWPGEDPIGRRIRFGMTDSDMRTIVGIVNDVRYDGLTVHAPTFYEPPSQAIQWSPYHLNNQSLMVRASGDPLTLAGPIRDAVRELDPNLPILNMRTMDDLVARSVAGPRFILTLLGVFAAVALVLGGIGIYGVIAQAVAHRTNEIGIRRALGAGSREVQVMVLGQGMKLVTIGIAVGLVSALALNRVLAGFLFQVSTTDPSTYAVVAGVVAVVAVVASVIPARRASRVDPLEALRAE